MRTAAYKVDVAIMETRKAGYLRQVEKNKGCDNDRKD